MAALAATALPPTILVIEGAKGLRNADGMFGKSDPYVIASCRVFNVSTKVIKNNLNPTWDQAILVVLPSSVEPVINLRVFDSDSGVFSSSDDFLGSCDVNLAEVLGGAPAGGWAQLEIPLGGDKKAKGTVTVSVRPYTDTQITVESCNSLRNADGMRGKSDPYAIVQGIITQPWGKTRVIQNDLNPVFNESFKINVLDRMPMGGKLEPCKVKFMDSDNGIFSSKDDPLGKVVVPWKELWPDSGSSRFTLQIGGKGGRGSANLATAAEAVAVEPEHPPAPEVTIPKANLMGLPQRQMILRLADCSDSPLEQVTLGLAWDMTSGEKVDLDASCIVFDDALEHVDTVYFNHLCSDDQAITHSGDQRSGEADGDDESIHVDLTKLNPKATYLGFTINSYSGHKLNTVTNAQCRLYKTGSNEPLATYRLELSERLDCTAFLMCALYRKNSQWFMHAIGVPAQGKKAKETLPELKEYLSQHHLMDAVIEEREPEYAVVKVPDTLGPNNTMQITTPSGGGEVISIPEGIVIGTAIRVPILAFAEA